MNTGLVIAHLFLYLLDHFGVKKSSFFFVTDLFINFTLQNRIYHL